MITAAENKKLTGVSAGTPLHDTLSKFWYPVLRANQLNDRCTIKIRLLGENFVIARNGSKLMAMDEKCPHRQCSLTLARVEDKGLRCIYHGWLMSPLGKVLEAPNEREEGGRKRIQIRTALLREAGGIIWMNMCANEKERAPFPDLPWFDLPANQVVVVDAMCRSNWVQSLEGAIDSSHSSHLHADEIVSKNNGNGSTAIVSGTQLQITRPSTDKHPRIHVRDTEFGFIYGALRTPTIEPDKWVYVRATAFAFPCYVTMPTSKTTGDIQIFVPIDDGQTHFFYIRFSATTTLDNLNLPAWSGLEPDKDLDESGYLRAATLPLWGQDRQAMAQGKSFTGLVGVNFQDIVVQESMGTIVDRTKENLGPADLAIVHFRRLLLETADGKAAAQPDFAPNLSYQGLKARDGLLPITQDWTTLYTADNVQWQSTP